LTKKKKRKEMNSKMKESMRKELSEDATKAMRKFPHLMKDNITQDELEELADGIAWKMGGFLMTDFKTSIDAFFDEAVDYFYGIQSLHHNFYRKHDLCIRVNRDGVPVASFFVER
jgi:hypothetical protein